MSFNTLYILESTNKKEVEIMNRKLVAYFSASGVTAEVAKNLAGAIGADPYEIVPETAYTVADLDWTNKHSRSTIEMNDSSFRPPIAGKCNNMEDYDTVFVGFPIWWYVAPTIINTFLESYDMSGKAIIPFATSGGSGMGKTNANLSVSCKGAELLDGRVFAHNAGRNELAVWAESFKR